MPSSKSESSVSSETLYQRPGFGKLGKPIKLRTNFIAVQALKVNQVHQYDISIVPETNTAVNWKLFQQIEALYKSTLLDETRVAYDGNKILISPKALQFGDMTTFQAPNKEHHSALMALDIILKHKLAISHVSVGGSFYFPENAFKLFGGIEAWQGVFHTTKIANDGLFINVNNTVSMFFSGIGLDELTSKVLGYLRKEELLGEFDENKLNKLNKAFRGLRIEVRHRGDKPRCYKIEGLTNTPASKTLFKIGETEEETDVEKYFNSTYNIRLQYKTLPCVIVKKGVMFPIEVCKVSGGQRFTKKLNERQTAEIIKFTSLHPNLRMSKISENVKKLDFSNNEYLDSFGIKINPEMEVMEARVLEPPRIAYNPDVPGGIFMPDGGCWNLRNKKVFQGSCLESWGVICFGNQSQIRIMVVQKFVTELVNTCIATGMTVLNRTPAITYINPQGDFEKSMRMSWKNAGMVVNKRPQLMLCILTNTSSQAYGDIKQLGEIVIGVPTQCMQSKHLFQPKKQYCANLCLKMNAKLGGVNVCLLKEEIPFIYNTKCIIFGADIAHSINRNVNSIASIVSTINPQAAFYYSSYEYVKPKAEIITGLEEMVKDGLKAYFRNCSFKPMSIIFYRNGVSDGQLFRALKDEVKSIKSACLGLQPDYAPSVTYIVIQKKHNVRFFPIDKQNADRSGNCLPGTVVDNHITSPKQFDFYLNSHSGIQGTSKPSRYIVLHDENNFDADTIQDISNKLCYTFLRSTRSVSIVPPVFYAHLLSARTMQYSKSYLESDSDILSDQSNSGKLGLKLKDILKDTMYYV